MIKFFEIAPYELICLVIIYWSFSVYTGYRISFLLNRTYNKIMLIHAIISSIIWLIMASCITYILIHFSNLINNHYKSIM